MPTAQEMELAISRLDELARPAVLAEIGGARPEKEDRAKSWWGGNFLGAEGESVPACQQSGAPMHPVVQIRVDELPQNLPGFEGIALLTLWMDLHSDEIWRAKNGDGFLVRTYSTLEDLVPLGPGFRESPALPTFPVFWRETLLEQPSWEDMAGEVPVKVARSQDDTWFAESRYLTDHYYKLRSVRPIKLGGWPAWIQGADWPADAEYVFQVDATYKGKLHVGDGGSVYIFKTPTSWQMRADCY